MWRYLVGAVVALMLAAGGLLIWNGVTTRDGRLLPPAPFAAIAMTNAQADDAVPEAPQATEKTREEKRFSRADHNKDGKIDRDEYLLARHKNFAKLDTDGDGKLSFDEYAAKAEVKFATADADKSGTLDATEFATTRVVRKIKPRCPPAQQTSAPPPSSGDDDNG